MKKEAQKEHATTYKTKEGSGSLSLSQGGESHTKH